MRKLGLGLLAISALAGASAAQATTYIGNTFGCFGAACDPTGGATATYGGLSFNTNNFNQADAGGVAHIGGTTPTDNFGTFTLSGLPFNYNTPPTLFTLLITFTSPPGASGASTFSSTITGLVTSNNAGGIFVDFDNAAHLYNSSVGPFTVAINDFDVSAGGIAAPITGRITALAVPEPTTWGMMLLGFAGIGMALRRRRRPALAQLA